MSWAPPWWNPTAAASTWPPFGMATRPPGFCNSCRRPERSRSIRGCTALGLVMKIAVFLPNWIGAAVMATPALRALREHFAQAHLIGVLKPYVAGVLEGSPWLDSQVFLDSRGPWARRWPAAAFNLRRCGVDLAVLFPN